MTEVSQQAAAMTQAVVGIPYLLTPPTEKSYALDTPPEAPIDLGPGTEVHFSALRLISATRNIERQHQEAPAGPWLPTEERRLHIRRQYPLAVHRLGRTLMQQHNERRLHTTGHPHDSALANGLELIPYGTILDQYEDSDRITEYLRRAGYFGQILPTVLRRRATRKALPDRDIPADALAYLQTFPMPVPSSPGEQSAKQLKLTLHAARETIVAAVKECGIYPHLRWEVDGASINEREIFTPEDIAVLKEHRDTALPPLQNGEVFVHDVENNEYHGSKVFTAALEASGLPIETRRDRKSGKPTRAVARPDLLRLRQIMATLTTPQEGEAGFEEISIELGVSIDLVRQCAEAEDIETGRKLYDTNRWRYVFQRETAKDIKTRARHHRLPPYLITESGIVKRFAPQPDSSMRKKLSRVRYDHGDQDLELHLLGSRPNRPARARSWSAMLALEYMVSLADDALNIDWDQLPYDRYDLEPDKIEYARWVQSKYTMMEYVDDMTVDAWIDLVKAEIDAGSVAVQSLYRGASKQRRQNQPVRLQKGLLLPDQALIDAVQLTPRGFPVTSPSFAECWPASIPPEYTLARSVALKYADGPYMQADICEATNAPPGLVRDSINKHRNGRKQCVIQGSTLERYGGELLDEVLIDLIGITIDQMSPRLDGAPAVLINPILRDIRAYPTPQGRYSRYAWDQIQEAYRSRKRPPISLILSPVKPLHASQILESIVNEPPTYFLHKPLAEIGTVIDEQNGPRHVLTVEDVARATSASISTIQQLISIQRSSYRTPETKTQNGRQIELLEGPLLQEIIIELVGLTAEQMSRRTHAPEEHIVNFLRSYAIKSTADGRYSNGVWKQVRKRFRPAPRPYSPLDQLPDAYTTQEWEDLARNLGVELDEYYTPAGNACLHVGPSGKALLVTQLTGRDTRGLPYVHPVPRWKDRFSLAAETGTHPEAVDRWMRKHINASTQIEWCIASVANMPQITILPYFDPNLVSRYKLYVKAATRGEAR